MQSSIMRSMPTPEKEVSLHNLTGNLSIDELRRALHPAVWDPVYLGALRVTVVEKTQLLHFAAPSPSLLINGNFTPTDLVEGLLFDGLFYWAKDARTRMLESIATTAAKLWRANPDDLESFIELVLKYLTEYTFTSETTTVKRFGGYEPPSDLSLYFNGQIFFFDPSIAVCTSDKAPIITVVTPSRGHGDPNFQLVGYLLAVAQKHFILNPERVVYRPLLIYLAAGSLAHFVTATVTRQCLGSAENGIVDDEKGGFLVRISDVFNLKFVAERVKFVCALTSIYEVLLYREVLAHIPDN
ncbi:unnamed protein product [Tuber melanosporum]|uniref:(Perigord truffle) hypothetical protein n=1 Tax=Tuber melanosporum (strain Mel28) TaxID=656061 RepID=D5GDG2_TUBMM|nr:uncharacterized protein GSTUM_00000997001 [Tuber melanosporum]CAZ82554.1 unnamed protein product [Tuber melanosporum]